MQITARETGSIEVEPERYGPGLCLVFDKDLLTIVMTLEEAAQLRDDLTEELEKKGRP